MEELFDSTGFQKFGHLEDKIKRTAILVDELEGELSLIRKSFDALNDQRSSLVRDNTILQHECMILENANNISYAKASEIAERVDEFLELFA